MNTLILNRIQRHLMLSLTLFITAVLSHSSTYADEEYLIGYMGVAPSKQLAHVLGFINPDGTEERYPDFGKPDQLSWVFGPQFADGFRIVLTSYEDDNLAKVRAGEVMTRDSPSPTTAR